MLIASITSSYVKVLIPFQSSKIEQQQPCLPSVIHLNTFSFHIDQGYGGNIPLPKLAVHTLAKSFLPLSHAVSYALPLSPLQGTESVVLVRGGGNRMIQFFASAIPYIRKRALDIGRLALVERSSTSAHS